MAQHASVRSFARNDDRWRAVEARDPDADGAFYYAVKTTGVYCRPSCPSRRPKQINVQYFAAIAEARAAGYRACKRCSPDHNTQTNPHHDRIMDACRTIENAETAPRLRSLAEHAGLSQFHFQRVFKDIVGLTPKQYEKAHRAKSVRAELGFARTVTEAIFDAGYHSSGRFYADAVATVGMAPARRRMQGAGETIRFAVGECSLGAILVAATARGVCAISLGDNPEQLVANLQDDFANAELIGGDDAFEVLVANVVGLVDNPKRRHQLPLDIRGTAFQQRVWRVLATIKSGQTATYADIARRMGAPRAVRAVAQACGANRLAVAIPCHRVIRSDGSLSGYRWGVERKQTLLDRECSR